jgi:hypothetical protein
MLACGQEAFAESQNTQSVYQRCGKKQKEANRADLKNTMMQFVWHFVIGWLAGYSG